MPPLKSRPTSDITHDTNMTSDVPYTLLPRAPAGGARRRAVSSIVCAALAALPLFFVASRESFVQLLLAAAPGDVIHTPFTSSTLKRALLITDLHADPLYLSLIHI